MAEANLIPATGLTVLIDPAVPESQLALAPTRAHLAEVGNLSSSSVLFLLDEARRSRPEPGSHGVLLAMGPGFCAELVLLQW